MSTADASPKFRLLGGRIPYVEGPLKVTGRAEYTDDIKRPGMLYGGLLRSPWPHARLVSIDVSSARSLPGVYAVLTGEKYPTPFGVLPITHDETAIAVGKARYIGDIIAAVAATDERTAELAMAAIRVEVEPLPEYADPQTGLAPVTEPIHARGLAGTNIQKEVVQHFGDVDAAFAQASHTVRVRGTFAGVTHAFTEPMATIAESTPDGRLTVWSATQVPHYLHRALSEVLGIPMHRIRVIKPEVGGGFGGKSDPLPHEIACAALALETGRPVKIRFDREDVFLTNHGRHPTQNDVRIAADSEGHLSAYDIQAVLDGGAWSSFGTVTTYYNGVLAMGPYRVPNFRYRGRRVYTNKPPSGAMRAHGGTNIRYSVEVALDELAESIGLDPFVLRERNALPPNSTTVNQLRITSTSFRQCLDASRVRSGWADKFRRLPFGEGIGLGCGFYISGSNSPIHFTPKMPQCTVHLKVDMDGGIAVHSMQADIGQGSNTLLAAIVAEVLGVDLDRVHVVRVDSDISPVDIGSYSSRVTFMMGNAARRAAEELLATLLRAASELCGYPVDQLAVERERYVPRHRPEVAVSFMDALHKAMEKVGALTATGAYSSPPMGGTFKGARAGTAPAYSFAAYVAQVRVDAETGEYHVGTIWAAFDCGRPLNRLAVEGQIEGSIHMGLGQLMGETMSYRSTRLMNPSLLEYKIPAPQQMPRVECLLVGQDDPEGPFGAKEAGEGPLVATLPAVANALYDAIGVRFHELPITPDRVVRGIEQRRKEGRPWKGA
ncbi:MAG: xanthine dehydrogenase family protein molybdopterin-binding subunit [Thermoplasmata archaeon]|nr:xanthine dehydrogenase family protein molybdopterin-binding subunit [Thermoplasmata archaeon]MCI4358917.1 xanthine dehydrogenase family protein molybdopterin-binding subunit [Thermoplasmata archaeon]